MILEILTLGLLTSTISFTVPLALAALGGLVADKSGVPNIALEGIIQVGGILAVVACFFSGNAWLGTVAAALIGALFAYFLGIICVREAGDIVVGGFAINFVCWGLAPTLSMIFFKSKGFTPLVEGFSAIRIPILSDIPILRALISYTPLTYFAIIAAILLYVMLYRTRLGKHIIAAGLDPFVTDTQGINVFRVRYIALIISGILAGIAGAEYSLGIIHRWSLGLSAGRGFIAIAAYLFGKRRPLQTIGACLLFGFLEALSIRLRQVLGWIHGATELTQMAPLVLTIMILGIIGKGELTKFAKPYRRE
ncbi:MAG: ABC transporter permease [Thaumarchaeota archaeon]|nr:MAG: ABC transporter permease [Nitrososphaerota archaeon]